jgi:hypothetical protein
MGGAVTASHLYIISGKVITAVVPVYYLQHPYYYMGGAVTASRLYIICNISHVQAEVIICRQRFSCSRYIIYNIQAVYYL